MCVVVCLYLWGHGAREQSERVRAARVERASPHALHTLASDEVGAALLILGARHPELSVRGLRVKSGERKVRAPSQAVWMRRAGAERAMDARIEPPSHAPLRRSGSGAVWMVMRFAC